MTNPIPTALMDYMTEILDQAQNGISITDPNQEDNPIIYVNKAFTQLFGYQPEEVIGRNCRFLQGNDREQSGITQMRHAIEQQKPTRAVLRNLSKSGQMIYNEVTISPIFDKHESSEVRYFLGVQKNVTKEQALLHAMRELIG